MISSKKPVLYNRKIALSDGVIVFTLSIVVSVERKEDFIFGAFLSYIENLSWWKVVIYVSK